MRLIAASSSASPTVAETRTWPAALAPKAGIRTHTQARPLAQANEALADLREGRVEGAAVLVTGDC